MTPRSDDIVFCTVTNRVLLAQDAVFDTEGNAYDPARVPRGVAVVPFAALGAQTGGQAEPAAPAPTIPPAAAAGQPVPPQGPAGAKDQR